MRHKSKRPRSGRGPRRRRVSAAETRALEAALERHRQGDLVAAEQGYRALLDRAPENADATHLLGVLYHQCGEHELALGQIDTAIALDANDPGFHNNRGEVLRALGRLEEAADAYERATRIDRNFADAWSNAALASRALGRLDDAESAARRAMALAPRTLEPLMALAECLGAKGEWAAAVEQAEVALRLNPQHPQVLLCVGLARQGVGDRKGATGALERVLDLAPGNAAARVALAHYCQMDGDTARAIDLLEAAVRHDPRSGEAWLSLGQLLSGAERFDEATHALEQASGLISDAARVLPPLAWAQSQGGRMSEALSALSAHAGEDLECAQMLARILALTAKPAEAAEAYRAVLARDAERGDAWLGLGDALIALGDFADAKHALGRALELNPDDGAAFESLASIAAPKEWTEDRRALLTRQCENPSLDVEERASMQFAAARLLDLEGDYERALAFYATANRLMAERFNFDIEAFETLVDEIVHSFPSAPALATPEAKASGRPAPRMVFVVGMPRSGTSLVEQILASHSEVFGAGEVEFFAHLRFDSSDGYPTACPGLSDADVASLRDQYLERLAGLGAAASWVSDKMPSNFLYLGLIARLFPEARVIDCQRSPLDTCLSVYMQNFSATGAHAYSFEPASIAAYYRGYQTLMAHWRTLFGDRIHALRYERVVAEPATEVRRLLDFVGLPFEDACLEFHLSSRPVLTASHFQVRQPLYASSVERWRRYGSAIEPLRAALDRLGIDTALT